MNTRILTRVLKMSFFIDIVYLFKKYFRVPEKISSPALRNHQDMDTENYDGPAIVQAQIEVHPGSSTSHETLDSTKYKSFEPVFHNLEPANNNDCSNNEKTKKLPSIRKKMKYMKRIFICSRFLLYIILQFYDTTAFL